MLRNCALRSNSKNRFFPGPSIFLLFILPIFPLPLSFSFHFKLFFSLSNLGPVFGNNCCLYGASSTCIISLFSEFIPLLHLTFRTSGFAIKSLFSSCNKFYPIFSFGEIIKIAQLARHDLDFLRGSERTGRQGQIKMSNVLPRACFSLRRRFGVA